MLCAVLQKTLDAMSVTVLFSCLFCVVLVVISASLINFSHMLIHVVSMIIKMLTTT